MENMLQDVRQVYARYLSQHFGGAREGDAEFQLQERYFHKNYLPHLPQNKNARIIDLGCGLGHFLYFMKRAGYTNILGVDVGKECIEFCKRKDLPVHEAEITNYLTTLPENSVDAFILNDVLEHQTKDRIWVLLELVRSRLTSNGTFLVKVPNMGNPLLGNDGRYIDITHEIGFDQHSLKQTLLMAKFSKARVVGTDIYVTKNPLTNTVAKNAARLLNAIFYLIFKLYGRTDTTIFTKNILGIAHK